MRWTSGGNPLQGPQERLACTRSSPRQAELASQESTLREEAFGSRLKSRRPSDLILMQSLTNEEASIRVERRPHFRVEGSPGDKHVCCAYLIIGTHPMRRVWRATMPDPFPLKRRHRPGTSRAPSRRDTLLCAAAGWIDVQRDWVFGVSQSGAAPIILPAQGWRRYG